MIDVADRLAIHELLALYGHLIDERRWEELDQVLAQDIEFDATDFGQGVTYSLADLLAIWRDEATIHPLAHHASNIVVLEETDGAAQVLSKGVGVGTGGRVGSVTYDDTVVRSPQGWRISRRKATLRKPTASPDASGPKPPSSEARLDAVESRLAIGELPIRYALAIDGRDLDSWVALFIPDVRVGRDSYGRDALRQQIEPQVRTFRRSMHQICGHQIDLDVTDRDRATGVTYCRAEHEVADRWIIMAIAYFDEYQRVEGEWFFSRRRERHWYAADLLEHPQAVDFASWDMAPSPALPEAFPTWDQFWR